MNSSTFEPVTSWPCTVAGLAALLGIKQGKDVRCHGLKRDKSACRCHISQASVKTINEILDEIAQVRRLTEVALSALAQLSSLVLCKRWHQDQAKAKETSWKSILCSSSTTQQSSATDNASTRNPEHQDSKPPGSNPNPPNTARQKPSSAETRTTSPRQTPNFYPRTPPREPSHHNHRNTPGCGPKHPRTVPSEGNKTHSFVPYGPDLATRSINAKIKTQLLTQLQPHDRNTSGYIYGFTFPDTHTVIPSDLPFTGAPLTPPFTPPGSRASTAPVEAPHSTHIKIGHSTAPDRRLAAIASQCLYTPRRLFALPAPHHAYVERLVHLQLHGVRRREGPRPCPGCGRRHIEWFEVDGAAAEKVVEMWTQWAARRPWDAAGRLKSEWVEKLMGVDLGDEKCWEGFLAAA